MNVQGRVRLRFQWTDLEELHIFVVRLFRKKELILIQLRANRIFALFRRAEACRGVTIGHRSAAC